MHLNNFRRGTLCSSTHLPIWRRWVQTEGCRAKRRSRRIRCVQQMTGHVALQLVVSAVVVHWRIRPDKTYINCLTTEPPSTPNLTSKHAIMVARLTKARANVVYFSLVAIFPSSDVMQATSSKVFHAVCLCH